MKFVKNKLFWLLAVLALSILVTALIVPATQKTKTSIVISTYSNSATDGCDGFKLKNGDSVDTFCFWAKPEEQTSYQDIIKVGDTVQYGTENGKQFIRLAN